MQIAGKMYFKRFFTSGIPWYFDTLPLLICLSSWSPSISDTLCSNGSSGGMSLSASIGCGEAGCKDDLGRSGDVSLGGIAWSHKAQGWELKRKVGSFHGGNEAQNYNRILEATSGDTIANSSMGASFTIGCFLGGRVPCR